MPDVRGHLRELFGRTLPDEELDEVRARGSASVRGRSPPPPAAQAVADAGRAMNNPPSIDH